MEKQYVYIFSISDKPDLIKVGKTSKNPHIRANELSKQTAATGKFSVEWFMEVPDAELAEKVAHFKLKEYYVNKEYFNVKSYDAHLILEKFLMSLFEIKKPVIVYCGSVELTKKMKNRRAISKKLFEKAMIEKPQIVEKVEIKKQYNKEEREERIKKFHEQAKEYTLSEREERIKNATEKLKQWSGDIDDK